MVTFLLLLEGYYVDSFESSTQGYSVTAVAEALGVVGGVVIREIVLGHRYVNA